MWSKELGLDGQAGVFKRSDCCAKMGGIPVNDDVGAQAEPSHEVVLERSRISPPCPIPRVFLKA